MTPTGGPLHVLHLEDSPLDHDLALAHLVRAGLDVRALRVESEAEYRAALVRGGWDVVLSDFNVPGFGGLQALQLMTDEGVDLPFILVSGQIGEDTAVAAMRNGATDYLLKNNLARLAPAVEHAIDAHRERRARLQADRRLALSRQRLAELAQHLQRRIEAERAAIAREIHDDVGGSLTALRFDLAWMGRHATSAPLQARLASAQESVSHALEASQRIMHNLRPAILEQGLVAALQWMSSRFEKRTAIPCSCRTPAELPVLAAGVPLVVYRFAQEALTNISKHAQASRVAIDLLLAGGVLSLEVADNGCGLSDADLAKASSFGLRGLQERAAMVGGWVDISGSPQGTVLLLSVPLRDSALAVAALETEDDAHDPSQWGKP